MTQLQKLDQEFTACDCVGIHSIFESISFVFHLYFIILVINLKVFYHLLFSGATNVMYNN